MMPPQLRRGTNPSGVRLYNERLALSLIRHHGALPKAGIARLTGLSPPTVQVIVQALEADGLLVRQEAQRGRVGQPSVPLSLNPDGAFSFGVKIGRRSAEIVLIDFVGTVRQSVHMNYRYPAPGADRRPRGRDAVRALELGERGGRGARRDAGVA